MVNYNFYKVDMKNTEGSYIFEYNVDDRFKSKRYYFISLDFGDVYRIKNIDDFIEYCDLHDINIEKENFSDKKIDYLLDNLKGIIKKRKQDNIIIENDKSKDYFYDSLDKNFTNYDYDINLDLIKKYADYIHILNEYNKIKK